MRVLRSDKKSEVIACFKQLQSVRAVARKTGACRESIVKWLHEEGLRAPGTPTRSPTQYKEQARIDCVQGRHWRGALVRCALSSVDECEDCSRGYQHSLADVLSSRAYHDNAQSNGRRRGGGPMD